MQQFKQQQQQPVVVGVDFLNQMKKGTSHAHEDIEADKSKPAVDDVSKKLIWSRPSKLNKIRFKKVEAKEKKEFWFLKKSINGAIICVT